MAIDFADGFEFYAADGASADSLMANRYDITKVNGFTQDQIFATSGRYSGLGIKFGDNVNNGGVRAAIPTSDHNPSDGQICRYFFNYRFPGSGSTSHEAYFTNNDVDNTSPSIGLYFRYDGQIYYLDNTTTDVSTDNLVIDHGSSDTTWHSMCFEITWGATSAVVILIDGVVVQTYSNKTIPSYTQVGFQERRNNLDTASHMSFDDLIVSRDDGGAFSFRPIDGSRVSVVSPESDTAQADFTSTAATGAETLDDAPISDSDYITSDAASEQSNFNMTDLTLESGLDMVGMIMHTRANNQEALNLLNYQMYMDDAVNTAALIGSQQVPPTGSFGSAVQSFYNTNPLSGAAWTQTELNGLIIGVQSQTP